MVNDFGLDVALALDADVLLHRHEGDACLGDGVEDGDDLTQRPTEPGEFADDQTVAALEDVHQLVEPAALFGSLSRVIDKPLRALPTLPTGAATVDVPGFSGHRR